MTNQAYDCILLTTVVSERSHVHRARSSTSCSTSSISGRTVGTLTSFFEYSCSTKQDATLSVRCIKRCRHLLQKHWRHGTSCKGFHSFTCTPTCLSANDVNRAFAFPAEAGPHFTDHRLPPVGWLHTVPRWFIRLKMVTHPSTYRAQRWLTSLIRLTMLTTTLRRQP